MGTSAAILTAAMWAIGTSFLASQSHRFDVPSISAVRSFWALVSLLVALAVLGTYHDLGEMSAGYWAEALGTGIVGYSLGDLFHVRSMALLGMTRAFTLSLALFILFTFLGSLVFLDESVTWEVALGAFLVLLGVYAVALRGRVAAPETVDAGSTPRPQLATAAAAADDDDESTIAGRSAEAPAPKTLWVPFIGVLPHNLALGLVLVVITSVVWAASAVWLRSISSEFDATAVATVRLPGALLVMTVVALLRPGSALRSWAFTRRSLGALALAGIIGTGISGMLFVFALQEIDTGKAVVLSSISPLFGLPIAAVFLHERITLWVAGGTVLAVAGIALIA